MGRKILQVVETAYRATIEKQDDTVILIAHAMKGGGADLSVLLRGNAVKSAGKGQDASGLAFGEKRQAYPPDLAGDVAKLIGKGVEVLLVEDDAAERGLERGDFIDGVKTISRSAIPKLFASYDQIW